MADHHQEEHRAPARTADAGKRKTAACALATALALGAPTGAGAQGGEGYQALAGTWTGSGRTAELTLRVLKIGPDKPAEGIVCATFGDGTMYGLSFSENDAKWSGIESQTKFGALTVRAGPYSYTYTLPQGRKGQRIGHAARRRGEPKALRTTLKATDGPTCADALVLRRDAAVPPPPTGEHPLIGHWSGWGAGHRMDMRIASIASNGAVTGVACHSGGHGTLRWWRLEHRKIKARAPGGEPRIEWRRRPDPNGLRAGGDYALVRIKDNVARLTRTSDDGNQRIVMKRGAGPRGCLGRMAPSR